MENKISCLFLALLLSVSASAQETLFPALTGFKLKTDYPVFTPDDLYDYIDGAADNYLAYGFADLHIGEFRKGKEVIKAEIYRHSNHTMAFGIYSSERSPSFRFMNLGAQGYIVDGAINFFKGNYYVKIKTHSKKEKTLQSSETLALKISQMLEGETIMPEMVGQFPSEGKKINEETYINESALGHSFLNKAFKASYTVGPDNFSIFIIQPGSIENTLKTVTSYLQSSGIEPIESNEGKYVLNDGYNGTIFLAWRNEKIVIIAGLAKDQADIAEKYTTEILK
jgi:hypothetical protein